MGGRQDRWTRGQTDSPTSRAVSLTPLCPRSPGALRTAQVPSTRRLTGAGGGRGGPELGPRPRPPTPAPPPDPPGPPPHGRCVCAGKKEAVRCPGRPSVCFAPQRRRRSRPFRSDCRCPESRSAWGRRRLGPGPANPARSAACVLSALGGRRGRPAPRWPLGSSSQGRSGLADAAEHPSHSLIGFQD